MLRGVQGGGAPLILYAIPILWCNSAILRGVQEGGAPLAVGLRGGAPPAPEAESPDHAKVFCQNKRRLRRTFRSPWITLDMLLNRAVPLAVLLHLKKFRFRDIRMQI